MRHLDDGALRRLIDEPMAAGTRDRLHLEGCASCQSRSESVAADAAMATRLLAVAEPAGLSPAAALARVRNTAVAAAPQRAWARWSLALPRLVRPTMVAVAVVALTGVSVAAAPALTQVFAPQSVASVPVTEPSKAEIAGLPDLSNYGEMTVLQKGTSATVLTAAEARELTGLTPPSAPPAYAGQTVTYTTLGRSVVKFTFSKAKAQAAAIAAGKPAPVFPAGIDNSTLTLTAGPAVGELFGTVDKNTTLANLPLVAGVAAAPQVTSSGVTAKQLEDFLIAQPGIAGHPDLIAQIKAIGDPLSAGTLVIPVPQQYATSQDTTINGVPAVLIRDKTETVRFLVWETKAGIVYAVGGHFDEAQLRDIATSIR